MAYGTLQLIDTLAANRTYIAQYGTDNAYRAISDLLRAHNTIMDEMISDLCETTTDRIRRYGGASAMTMEDLDEFGRPDAQKLLQGVDVGFPLKKYGMALQWTNDYFQNHTVAELAAQVDAAMTADVKNVEKQIKTAIFTPTNNTTYADRFTDGLVTPLRAFLNADSTAIPADPWGNTFNTASHTHYIGTSSFVAADLTSLITLALEHYNTGRVKVYINQAQEATVRGFTGFNAYMDARIVPATTTTYAGGAGLDMMNVYNRAIGVFGSAEVWVKPWMISGYAFAFNADQRKPLAFRQHPNAAMSQLQILSAIPDYPLYAQFIQRYFGIGVQERANGAVLDCTNASYTLPTIS